MPTLYLKSSKLFILDELYSQVSIESPSMPRHQLELIRITLVQ